MRAQALINGRPEETTALLMRLCTSGEGMAQGGEPAPVTAQIADFAHLFADRCGQLLCLCHVRGLHIAGLGNPVGTTVVDHHLCL